MKRPVTLQSRRKARVARRLAFAAHVCVVVLLVLASWIAGMDTTGTVVDVDALWMVTFAAAAALFVHLPARARGGPGA